MEVVVIVCVADKNLSHKSNWTVIDNMTNEGIASVSCQKHVT